MSFESPENLPEFFNRLAAGLFPPDRDNGMRPQVTDDFLAFRAECEARHAAGESTFGDAWRSRDNKREGMEEGSDAANYAAYDHWQYLADTGTTEDPDFAVVLTAAAAAFELHKALRLLAARRAGSP